MTDSQTQTPPSPMIPTSTSGSMPMQMQMDERTNLEPYPSHTYLMNERSHPQVQGQRDEHPDGNTQSQLELPSITSFWARRDPSSSLAGVQSPGSLTRISSARGGDGGDAGSGSGTGTGIGNGPVGGNGSGSGSGSGMRVYGYTSSNARDLGYSPYPRPSHKRSR